jgi:glycosyltransferase involved in cell wall biosynthesis
VDINRLLPGDAPAAAPEVLYVGSFRHFPNVLGFEKLLNEVMPQVWRRCPEARLVAVAGPEPEARLREFRQNRRFDLDPRVQLHGFVGDLRPLYAQASVVVAPLVVSAGTNIKVLEAMSCGKAIVATPVAVNGLGLLDNQSVLIRSDWFQFAEAVASCLGSAEIRARIGLEARRIAEQRFHWGKIADRAYESYLNLAAAGQHPAPLQALDSVEPARLAANRFRPSVRL